LERVNSKKGKSDEERERQVTTHIRKVVRVFEDARAKPGGCVLFFDEIDSLCRKRTDSEDETTRRVKNELLQQLDGEREKKKEERTGAGEKERGEGKRSLSRGEGERGKKDSPPLYLEVSSSTPREAPPFSFSRPPIARVRTCFVSYALTCSPRGTR
jgi:SpoVK/Ycf46/Vps4 family AAA+-type ATPase